MPRVCRLLTAAVLALAAAGAGAAALDAQQAGAQCEKAVETTVRDLRGRDVESVEFTAGKRSVVALTDDETAVKGEGRYRLKSDARTPKAGARPFTYTCSVDPNTAATSGVLLRESRPPQAASAPAWQPDLANVSPADCQSAIVAQLKQRNPRVANIVFDADARSLEPAENDGTALVGKGVLQRAPGMNSVSFGYRCAFDANRGRLVAAQARD